MAKKKLTCDDENELINRIIEGKTLEEQVISLKNILQEVLEHGWIDEELRDQLMYEIAQDYNIPYRKQ